MTGKKSIWSYLAAAGTLLLLWELAAMVSKLAILPSPQAVAEFLRQSFWQLIAVHLGYSLWRIAAGIALSIAVGFPLGAAMGCCQRCDRLLSPLVYFTYPVPKIALLPLSMLLFGLGETAKIVLIMLIVVFQIVIAVRDGVKNIPREMYYPLYSLGASGRQIFWHVIAPAVLPKLLTAVRVAMATAVSVLFFTETFGTEYGMGYFIMDAWMRVDYTGMYGGMVVLSLMGLAIFSLLDWLEQQCCAWQYK